MVKVGDRVRMKPGSDLRELLGPCAAASAQVMATHQVDDEELRITLLFEAPEPAYAPYLAAEEFEVDPARPVTTP